jgi:flagellar basal body-associated protein FliL
MGGISTAVILIVVLVLLVLGDLAVVRAWTHRKRTSDPVEPNEAGDQDPPTPA